MKNAIFILGLFTQSDIDCLAHNVYHEARNQPVNGQRAVVEVVLNRLLDNRWPDSICEVVYQPYQFSWTIKEPNIKDKESLWACYKVVIEVLYGNNGYYNPTQKLYYHRTDITPKWDFRKLKQLYILGEHIFYADK